MGWKGITLVIANKVFTPCGVQFQENEVEGGYLAIHPKVKNKKLRRTYLTDCCIAVVQEWLQLKEENEPEVST